MEPRTYWQLWPDWAPHPLHSADRPGITWYLERREPIGRDLSIRWLEIWRDPILARLSMSRSGGSRQPITRKVRAYEGVQAAQTLRSSIMWSSLNIDPGPETIKILCFTKWAVKSTLYFGRIKTGHSAGRKTDETWKRVIKLFLIYDTGQHRGFTRTYGWFQESSDRNDS